MKQFAGRAETRADSIRKRRGHTCREGEPEGWERWESGRHRDPAGTAWREG